MAKIKIVGIVGHFGTGKNLLNGQTIKTKIITEELSKQLTSNDILTLDTCAAKKNMIKIIFYAIKLSRKCKNIIIMPAKNGLRFFVPLFVFFKKIFSFKLHYAVIGGWLNEFLDEHKSIEKKLHIFDYIYVETKKMKTDLENKGLKNIVIMPNCKNLEPLAKEELIYTTEPPFALCTFSRVMFEKGIEDAVYAVQEANRNFSKTVFTLDIYGQIDKNYKERFDNLCKTFPDYINYKGLIPFNKSVDIIKNYFALLFPTYFLGEGFAGTLIDAFSAGVPVIASDVFSNREIITNGKNGYLYEYKNKNALCDKLIWIATHSDEWNKMKTECINKAIEYLPETVVRILTEKLY